MRSFYITCDLFLREKKKRKKKEYNNNEIKEEEKNQIKSKFLEKDRIFLVFLTVFSNKRKKQAASKKEAGGDAKHVLFFLLRLMK